MQAHGPRLAPAHDWDEDACCIHCGIDGADIPQPRSQHTPPCTVYDAMRRLLAWQEYMRERRE